MQDRQSRKVRGAMKDVERERQRRIDAEIAIAATLAFVSDDRAAMTYQTLGQYRAAIIGLLQRVAPSTRSTPVGRPRSGEK